MEKINPTTKMSEESTTTIGDSTLSSSERTSVSNNASFSNGTSIASSSNETSSASSSNETPSASSSNETPSASSSNGTSIASFTNGTSIASSSRISPAAVKGRSKKQQESDKKAAEMLEEMRILYSREFANIPVENRPKPPSWAARAAIYKNQNDRKKYFQELIQGSRNSLEMKTSSNYKMSEGNTTTLVDNIITSLKRLTEDAKTLKRSMTRRGNNIFSKRINNSNISENNMESQYELTTPIQSLPRTKKRKRPHSRLTPSLNF